MRNLSDAVDEDLSSGGRGVTWNLLLNLKYRRKSKYDDDDRYDDCHEMMMRGRVTSAELVERQSRAQPQW